MRAAAVLVVGSELVTGVRLDTNSTEVTAALLAAGFAPDEVVARPDDEAAIAETVRRLVDTHDLVVVTGGLGPTHDDVTREAVSRALGLPLVPDPRLAERLTQVARRHRDPEAAAQVVRQADVLEGARVLEPATGTAPGQVVSGPWGHVVLLPGPPHEMRPMLESFLGTVRVGVAPRFVRCVGISESDVQVTAQRLLDAYAGIGFTVLASPALVDAVLFDAGAGGEVLDRAAAEIASALAEDCYSTDGSTLAETVIALARDARCSVAVAESCTGGLLGGALTEVPGASDVFCGGIVSYADDVKTSVLGVPPGTLRDHGAVSAETAAAMAEGVRERLGADLAVAVTGIAGPGGGTPSKPVGTVWFAVADADGSSATLRHLFGDRDGIRTRAVVTALDLLRREIGGRAR